MRSMLGHRDSNPDSTVQSRMSCHWTMSQNINYVGTGLRPYGLTASATGIYNLNCICQDRKPVIQDS